VRTVRHWARNKNVCLGLLIVLGLAGCGPAYRFLYHYTMVSPPGGTEGIEDEQVRIGLVPEPKTGIMQLTVVNKTPQTMAIVWEQTRFVAPDGRRRSATPVVAQWHFRPPEETRIAPRGSVQTRVQAGTQQRTFNPFTVTRLESGAIAVSTAPQALLPSAGKTSTVGRNYQGREFQFVLALRHDQEMTHYPFIFRITEVEVH
jgi:hypothetical protein